MPAATAPLRSTPCSRAPSSTVSIRSTISPTCSPASLTTRRGGSPNSCPGTGNRSTPPALPPEPARSPSAYVEAAIVIDGSRDPVASRRFDDLVKEAQLVIEAVTEVQARIAREAFRDFGRGSGHPARL